MQERVTSSAYLRNFIFGVEDSLVSTVGLLSGVAIAGLTSEQLFATGLILIFVEAISMASGSFLSESSAEEYETHKGNPTRRSYGAAAIMFGSYFVSGFIPLAPYLIFTGFTAFWTSIGLSVGALFLLGLLGAAISHTHPLKTAFRMAVIGGLAIGVGVLVGSVLA